MKPNENRRARITERRPLPIPSRQAAAHAAAIALVLGVAALVFAQTRGYGLLGMDNYPIILTSRVLSAADLWGNLSERLMDGYYEAAFYRPLLNLSFAVDYALWGLAAPGYQFSNVLCFAACALALYAFLVTRPVPRATVYAVAGVVFFLFHPLLFEVVPFPPRRPELLCSTFMLLALAAEAGHGWRYRVLGGAAALLALGAKETALILPVLIFLRMLLYAPIGGVRGRMRAAAGRALVSMAPVVLYLAGRFAVLGGMGGRGQIDLGRALEALPRTWDQLVWTVTSPSSPGSWTAAVIWLLAGLPPLLLAWIGRRPRGGEADEARRGYAADVLFSLAWLVVLSVIYALSKRLSPWYLVVAVVAFAIAFAGICEGYGRWSRERRIGLRAAGAAGLALVVLLALQAYWRWSPIVRSYDVWRQATIEDARLLERFEQTLEQTPNGSVTRLPAELKKIVATGDASMFQGVVLQAHYSLQAWAELRLPERRVRVLKNRKPLKAEPLRPTEVVVILDRRPVSKRPPPAPDPGAAGKMRAAGGTSR